MTSILSDEHTDMRDVKLIIYTNSVFV